jgi:hypothetical protein
MVGIGSGTAARDILGGVVSVRCIVLGALLILLAAPSSAQSPDEPDDDIELDDDIDIDETDEEPEPTAPPPPPPPEEVDETEGDEEFDEEELDEYRDPAEDETDLLGDEEVAPVSDDTEAQFRAEEARLRRLGPDEEVAGWEAYLARYPSSAYRKRIEIRTEQLMDQLYTARPTGVSPTDTDALRAEIDFAHPLQLENINPRSRLELAFEWGLPNYMNFVVDYEHQFVRDFSLHGGVRRRYLGWNVEVGPRWAIIKSTRTQTLLTLIGDFHLNTNPVYPGLRPQLALGKIFGRLHASIQAGPDFELRSYHDADGSQSELQTKLVGGANFYYAASERVGLFLEGYANMKLLGTDNQFDASAYRFNVASFGLKFYPASGPNADERNMEVNVGATIPFMQQYWQFHYGSIMGQFNYYL